MRTGTVRHLRYEGRLAFRPSEPLADILAEFDNDVTGDPDEIELLSLDADHGLSLWDVDTCKDTRLRAKARRLAGGTLNLMTWSHVEFDKTLPGNVPSEVRLRAGTGNSARNWPETMCIIYKIREPSPLGIHAVRTLHDFLRNGRQISTSPISRAAVSTNVDAVVGVEGYITRPSK